MANRVSTKARATRTSPIVVQGVSETNWVESPSSTLSTIPIEYHIDKGEGALNSGTTDTMSTMTGLTAPNNTTFGSVELGSLESWRAFADDATTSAWYSADNFTDDAGGSTATKDTHFVGVILDTNDAINKITVLGGGADNFPKDFYIQGSTDTTTGTDGAWTDLSTVTDSGVDGTTPQTFIFDNAVEYKAYRINITRISNATSTNCIVGEIELIPTQAITTATSWVSTDAQTQGDEITFINTEFPNGIDGKLGVVTGTGPYTSDISGFNSGSDLISAPTRAFKKDDTKLSICMENDSENIGDSLTIDGTTTALTLYTPDLVATGDPLYIAGVRNVVGTVVVDGTDDGSELILHFDNNILDSSTTPHILTATGTPISSATQSKFGGYSGYIPDTSSYWTIPNHPDFQFGTGDFNIDFWVYFTSDTPDDYLIGNYGTVAVGEIFAIQCQQTYLSVYKDDGVVIGSYTITKGTGWHHIEVSRTSGTVYTFYDGVSVGTTADSTDFTIPTLDWNIGRAGTKTNGQELYFDEIRIQKGVAGHTTGFTLNTLPYGTLFQAPIDNWTLGTPPTDVRYANATTATERIVNELNSYKNIDVTTAGDGSNIVSTDVLTTGERIVVDGVDAIGGTATFSTPLYTLTIPNHTAVTTTPTEAYTKGSKDLTFVSSTTTSYSGTISASGLLSVGDTIQLVLP